MNSSYAVIQYHNGNFVMIWEVFAGKDCIKVEQQAKEKATALQYINSDSSFVVIPVWVTVVE